LPLERRRQVADGGEPRTDADARQREQVRTGTQRTRDRQDRRAKAEPAEDRGRVGIEVAMGAAGIG